MTSRKKYKPSTFVSTLLQFALNCIAFVFLLQVGLNAEVESRTAYSSLISTLCDNSDILARAHESVFNVVGETEEYVKTWTSYQKLWDLQSDQVYAKIGNNLDVSVLKRDNS